MSYRVYSISGAPRPWRVSLAMMFKGLDYELETLVASKGEHKAPAFLALNPRGRVPVIRDGDFVLAESLAIISYLDERHPEPPLLGTTPEEHGRIWQIVFDADHHLREAASAFIRLVLLQGQDDANEAVVAAAPPLHAELAVLESRLARTTWLAGARASAAECVCFPEVRLVLRAIERFPAMMQRLGFEPFAAKYPRLQAWVDRIEALPGYARTFPAHWKTA
jgi:glutathione S-transferase